MLLMNSKLKNICDSCLNKLGSNVVIFNNVQIVEIHNKSFLNKNISPACNSFLELLPSQIISPLPALCLFTFVPTVHCFQYHITFSILVLKYL